MNIDSIKPVSVARDIFVHLGIIDSVNVCLVTIGLKDFETVHTNRFKYLLRKKNQKPEIFYHALHIIGITQ
jgi:hypothetical protein